MKPEIEARVMAHGVKLLRIFPDCTERRPVELCRKLRRLEAAGQVIALRLCNGPPFSTEQAEENACNDILRDVNALLKFRDAKVPVLLNRDPRGYALKIDDEYVREHDLDIHRDWGGYGILAPDLRDE